MCSYCVIALSFIVLIVLFIFGVKTSDSQNQYVKFSHEVTKNIFPVLVIALLGFIFKKQIYFYFLRAELDIQNDKITCVRENNLNQVWKCKLPALNLYSSPIRNRVYRLKPTVDNYNFTNCLEGKFNGVELIKQDNEFECKYNISIDGNNEVSIPFTISGGEEIPQFKITEV